MPKTTAGLANDKKIPLGKGLTKMERFFRELVDLSQPNDPRTPTTESGTTGKKSKKTTQPEPDAGSTRKNAKTPGKGVKVNSGNNTFREPKTYRKAHPGMQESTEDSPEKKDEKWGAKKDRQYARTRNETVLSTMHLIPWSGYVNIHMQRVRITNTCTIDNHMQILFALYLFKPRIKQFLIERGQNSEVGGAVVEVLQDLTREDVSSAREKWVNILFAERVNISVKRNVLDLYGSDQDMFLDHIASWFPIVQTDNCVIQNCPFSATILTTMLGIDPHYTCQEFLNIINTERQRKCRRCKGNSTRSYAWGDDGPPRLFCYVNYSPSPGNTSRYSHPRNAVPKTQNIMGAMYDVFAVVYFSPVRKHYMAVFYHDDLELLYDGMYSRRGLTRVKNELDGCYMLSIWLVLQ